MIKWIYATAVFVITFNSLTTQGKPEIDIEQFLEELRKNLTLKSEEAIENMMPNFFQNISSMMNASQQVLNSKQGKDEGKEKDDDTKDKKEADKDSNIDYKIEVGGNHNASSKNKKVKDEHHVIKKKDSPEKYDTQDDSHEGIEKVDSSTEKKEGKDNSSIENAKQEDFKDMSTKNIGSTDKKPKHLSRGNETVNKTTESTKYTKEEEIEKEKEIIAVISKNGKANEQKTESTTLIPVNVTKSLESLNNQKTNSKQQDEPLKSKEKTSLNDTQKHRNLTFSNSTRKYQNDKQKNNTEVTDANPPFEKISNKSKSGPDHQNNTSYNLSDIDGKENLDSNLNEKNGSLLDALNSTREQPVKPSLNTTLPSMVNYTKIYDKTQVVKDDQTLQLLSNQNKSMDILNQPILTNNSSNSTNRAHDQIFEISSDPKNNTKDLSLNDRNEFITLDKENQIYVNYTKNGTKTSKSKSDEMFDNTSFPPGGKIMGKPEEISNGASIVTDGDNSINDNSTIQSLDTSRLNETNVSDFSLAKNNNSDIAEKGKSPVIAVENQEKSPDVTISDEQQGKEMNVNEKAKIGAYGPTNLTNVPNTTVVSASIKNTIRNEESSHKSDIGTPKNVTGMISSDVTQNSKNGTNSVKSSDIGPGDDKYQSLKEISNIGNLNENHSVSNTNENDLSESKFTRNLDLKKETTDDSEENSDLPNVTTEMVMNESMKESTTKSDITPRKMNDSSSAVKGNQPNDVSDSKTSLKLSPENIQERANELQNVIQNIPVQ